MKKASDVTYTNTVVRHAPTRISPPAQTVNIRKYQKKTVINNTLVGSYNITAASGAKAKTLTILFDHSVKNLVDYLYHFGLYQ
jgi:hypothetical protein